MPDVADALVEMLRTVLLPLIEADDGALYVVSVSDEEVRLHLAGQCGGCPGAEFTTSGVIEPAVHAIAPEATVHVTTGWRVPEGAYRITGR